MILEVSAVSLLKYSIENEVTNDCLENKTSFSSVVGYRKILQIKISVIKGIHFKITYNIHV